MALKRLPVHRYSVVISHFLVLWDCTVQHLFESRVALNSGLGGVRNVVSVIISHEQTKNTESAVFKLYMLYFQRILFTDNLETTIAVARLTALKRLPVHRYVVVILTFSVPLRLCYLRAVALNSGLGGVRDVAYAIISHEQTQ